MKKEKSIGSKIILNEVDIKTVIPYERNPRKNDQAVEKVIESIKEVGYRTPIIVDEDMVILAGHTRLKALQKLGWEKIPFIIQYKDFSKKLKEKFRIRDNKTSEYASWDYDILLEDFEQDELVAMGFDNLLTEEAGEVPDVEIQGEVQNKSDYLIVQFDNLDEYDKVKLELGLKRTQRVINYEDIKKQWKF